MFGGTGGGFGSGGFGQANQQQSTGGGFGTGTGTGFGGGGGGFGQPAQNQASGGGFGSGGFGSNTQSTGFGASGFGAAAGGGFGQQNKPFGSTPATTGGGGLFGTTATTGTGFGAGATGSGGFGNTGGTGFSSSTTGTGLFGSKPAATGFGTTGTGIFGSSTTASSGFGSAAPQTSGFGAAAGGDNQPPAQGTATSPFNPFTEKDAASSMTNHFQTISFQAPYQKWSLEELRMQDYSQGRTKAAGPTGGFGSTGAGFGAFGQQQQQQQQQPATGGFGQPQASGATGGGLFGTAGTGSGFGQASSGFGASTTGGGGLFGAKPAASGTGIFGSSTTGTTSTGTGLFGQQQQQPAAGGGFGTAASTTTGGFGQPAQPASGGLFGAQNQQKPSGFGTGFGSTGTTTGTGFGQASGGGGGLFGQPAASTSTTSGGLFGTAQQQPASGFGQPASGGAFGGFGQQAQQQQQQQPASTGFGAFGQQAQTPNKPAAFGGGFGAASTTPAPAATGGLFGQQQQPQPASGGGLFGKPFGSAATQQPSGGGLFGQQPQQPAQSGGLFGQAGAAAAAPSGGLFGQQQQQQQPQGGLFGNQQKPAGTGLFGQAAQTGGTGGLFGSAGTAPQPQGSLFGQQNPTSGSSFGLGQTTSGGFGSNPQPSQAGFGGSLFSQAQQQQPPAFTASLMDQRPYGNVPLLDISLTASASPSMLATPLSGSTKKKAAMIPHNKIAPRQPALSPRVGSPFSRSTLATSSSMVGGSLGRTFNGSSSRIGLGGSVFDSPGASDDSILNTSAFTPGGSRSANLKRLVIDRNLRDADLFIKEGEVKTIKGAQDTTATPDANIRKTVSFDAGLRSETASPSTGSDLGYMRTPTRQTSGPSPSPVPQSALVPVPSPQQEAPESEMEEVSSESIIAPPAEKQGDYWCIPTLNNLKAIPRDKLSEVPDLIVGRTNFGQIRFDIPVDLTGLTTLDTLLGGVITFGDRVCTVYPPGWDKPPPGDGLNVPATITLEDCFPTDREHKQPIRDPEHPRYVFHLKRLRNVKDTEFVDYIVQEGTWVFKVKHFTTYGLADDDEEMEESMYSEATPTRGGVQGYQSSMVDESSFVSGADITFEDDSIADDTFEFKRSRKGPALHHIMEPESSDILEGEGSSGESVENSDLSEEEDTTQILPRDDVSVVGEDDTQLAIVEEEYREATPESKLGVGVDWTDQLNRTISPVKNRVPFGVRGPSATAKNPFADISNVDFTESLFASRARDFESPYRPAVRTFASPVINRSKKAAASSYKVPETFNESTQQPDENDWHQCVRPSWGPSSEIIFVGSIEGGRPKGFNEGRSPKTSKAKLKYSTGSSPSAIQLLGFQLAASEITQDHANIPLATLDRNLHFSQFAGAKYGIAPQQQHEKHVWQLASILFDPMEDGLPEATTLHVKLHLRDKKRKHRLSTFFEQVVASDITKDEKAASTAEASAFAFLSGHRVEDAVQQLITGSDLRLATLIPLVGGDKQTRGDVKKQIQSWRSTGTLAEVPLEIRALYELVSGNVGFSEGVTSPEEDATPSFWLGEMFGLDWRRTFALRLWYEIFEDEKLEQAVAKYENAFRKVDTQQVRHPEPWYRFNADEASENDDEFPVYDTLWGLLKMYTDDNYPLEKVILPSCYSPAPCDFRLAWQLKMMFSEKQIRNLAGLDAMDEESEGLVAGDKLTVDFASQLEAEGEWQWAVFVLMHLSKPESRANTIKDILAKHVNDLGPHSAKLDFILHRLLIPSSWVYEAKALQARFQQDHFEEVDCLLNASAWNEAHKTLLNYAAPICVINEDLEKLYNVLCKFHDSTIVENWATGAQVYLDFIFLSVIVQHNPGFSPAVPKVRGLVKGFSKREVARRLMDALPKMDKKEFLPGVAVREMSKVLADFVMKSEEMKADTGKVLSLPLTEDQILYKELTIKMKEGMVIG